MKGIALQAWLDSLYSTMQNLNSPSLPEDFNAFRGFFDNNCVVYLKNMREYAEPSIGTQASDATQKGILADYYIEERRVLSRATSEDGLTIILKMKNSLNILGNSLDRFYETAVAVFNEHGLITGLKIYSCHSHIVGMIR